MEPQSPEVAITVAQSFVKQYYDLADKMRHKIAKLYNPEGSLVWNGSHVKGNENIQKFIEELPTSDHKISTLDSQPVAASAVQDQSTILISTSGSVKYSYERKPFVQTFLITVVGDKWSIVSDCFRFQEPLL